MNNLCLRDQAFLASNAAWTPDETDPDIWGWWSGDKNVTLAAGTYGQIDVWGDRCSRTADKTDKTDTRNLSQYTAVTYRPGISYGTGTVSNLLRITEDMSSGIWQVSNFTKNTATTGTFTAANGVLYQQCSYTRAGATYRLRAKIRAISGNTNLHFYHLNSPTGNSTAITVDGTLKEYTCTFAGHATAGDITVGIQDQNGAGWGQIEVTEWQLTESTHSTTYVNNTDALCGLFPAVDGHKCVWVGGNASTTQHYLMTMNWSGPDNLATPCTWYLCYWQRTVTNNMCFVSLNPAWAYIGCLRPADPAGYVNAAPFNWMDYGVNVTEGSWYVLTWMFNGATSEVRLNKGAAVAGNLGTITQDRGFNLGGGVLGTYTQDMAVHELLIRSTADNTATQDQYIDYLAGRVGLVV